MRAKICRTSYYVGQYAHAFYRVVGSGGDGARQEVSQATRLSIDAQTQCDILSFTARYPPRGSWHTFPMSKNEGNCPALGVQKRIPKDQRDNSVWSLYFVQTRVANSICSETAGSATATFAKTRPVSCARVLCTRSTGFEWLLETEYHAGLRAVYKYVKTNIVEL